MNNFIAWLEKNHLAIIFSLIVLLTAGVLMFPGIPKDVFPTGNFPRFQIVADIGFASLEETEINVTRPLEEALKSVPDVEEVRSVTERGTSTIDIFLKWGTDLDQAFQVAQTRLNQARSQLPPDTAIDITRMTTSAFPMSEYGVWSDTLTQRELFEAVRYTVIPKLIGISGIYGLDVIGGEEPEIWVKLDPAKLVKYNLDTASVGRALDEANKVSFIGNIVQGGSVFFASGGRKYPDTASLGNTVIASRMGRPILLKDVAGIEDSHAEARRLVTVNGHRGLFIDVRKQQNADGPNVSSQLDARMAEIGKEFGDRLNIVKWDLSDFVSRSIQGIMTDIIIGIIIILLIVYYVLQKLRHSLPIMIVMPVVVVLEFAVLKLAGLTINIMTLGGLAAAIGIIADNAIVVTENYVRFQNEGAGKDTLVSSMIYIVPIMLWATLASIIVFIPLNILSGVSGMFFRPLAVTLATTIVISLGMSVIVIPVFIKYFIETKEEIQKENRERFLFSALKNLYLKTLRLSLRHAGWVLAVNALLISAAALTFLKLPNGFLPEWDEGDIVLDYIAPSGSSIEGTDAIMARVEEEIKKIPETAMFIRKTGTHLGTPFAPPTVGEIVILLKKEHKRSTFEVMDELRNSISASFPGLDTDFHQMLPDRLNDLTGSAKPIVVSVLGNDFDSLKNTAEEIKNSLEKIKGLNSVLVEMPPAQKEIKVVPDQEEVSLLGLNLGDVFNYSRLALYGEVVSNFRKGLQMIPIREFYKGEYRTDISKITGIPVYTPNGGVLPLGKLAEYKMVEEIPEIHHENGTLNVNVTAEISGRPLGDVMLDIKNTLSAVKTGNFTLELGGNYKDQQTSFKELLEVLLISIILILTVLLFIFESFRTAIAVFGGTLCSATFVIFGLFATGTEFDVSSFTGMITVMGIVVNNGILVIDFVERHRREGKELFEAVHEAAGLRFRPVLITNLAAIAGFLPMALNIGQGGEVLRPFSIAMISGLVGSMFFSLVVMPVFYSLLHKAPPQ